MSTANLSPEEGVAAAGEAAARIRTEIRKVMVGQDPVVDGVLIGLFAAGHVLIEGVPGLGKTLLVRALARSFHGQFQRIQFTPDLMPNDVVGHVLYDQGSGQFRIRRGPVFTNLLLADEINRAPAKTQSALLEVMQELQVTIEGKAMAVPGPFMVLATQNPIEHEGTYPLPEAQLDRFLLNVLIDYPPDAEERAMVRRVTQQRVGDVLDVSMVQPRLHPEDVRRIQQTAGGLRIDEQVSDYAVRIARTTRSWPGVGIGAGPRGGIALVRCARAAALLDGRDFVTPDDVKAVALPALRHRIRISPELELEGQTPDDVLRGLLEQVDAPRQ